MNFYNNKIIFLIYLIYPHLARLAKSGTEAAEEPEGFVRSPCENLRRWQNSGPMEDAGNFNKYQKSSNKTTFQAHQLLTPPFIGVIRQPHTC
jgi:hypothetical protein